MITQGEIVWPLNKFFKEIKEISLEDTYLDVGT